ncbi:neprilysin-2 isoform X2 [Eupeodes corollae]|uniref:neprilysin-2 isoform X2 n=1 Tax=Eupeodes corollae TaxID=290404 RepID=UPI0024904DFA|nr:neprilysin-2 isoform X2 [Eupeodes corollae]
MTSGMQTVITNPNWWKRRSTLERCLTLLCVFALATIIGLVIGLVSVILSNQMTKDSANAPEALQVPDRPVTKPTESSTKKDEICLLPECIHTASNILDAIDPTVEPCDDFYQFACGNFIRTKTIPEDKVSISSFSDINDKLQEQLKALIEDERDESSPKHFQLPNKLYKACMNKTLIEELGSSPIANISESLGGWPVIKGESWNSDNAWTWQETVRKFRNLGFSMDYILDFSIGVDLKNSTKRLIDIDQSAIGLSREFLVKGLNDTLVLAYFDYMVDIAVIFGADRDVALKELGESLQFEIDLANISWPNEKRRNSSALYNLRTVGDLDKSYPYIGSWKDYINALLPKNLQIDEDEPINVSVPSFFDDLGPLLAKTPKRTICNYMMWRIHAFSISFLSEEFRKRQLEYATALSGRQEQEARWKECVDITGGSLAISIGSLYVRRYFKENAKHIALEMVENIRSVFSGILTQVDWMDEQTRKSALEKLSSMTTHIGYPDEIIDDAKLSEYYDSLDIDSSKYFESFLKMNVFGTDKSFNKLRLPVNKTDWVRHARPAVVNAFYSSLENSIQFPAGILQGQFFHAERPKYMNYGAIGYVIGHEITHGFDDQGRQFDVHGNLVDWWQENTKEAYLSKAKCIIEQYGNYTEKSTGLNLNGINTQGENIADNGGIKESYLAYRKWAQKNGPEPKLPGLDFKPEQMFWLSAAQTWCSKQRKESLKMRITTGVHSPSEFRVLGPISNMQDFAKDFQCPEGSPMNPVKKCEVW